MGNCLRSNKVTAYSPAEQAKKVERIVPATGSAIGEKREASGSDGGAGIGRVVRIKVVMSWKELERILKDGENDCGSFEKLIGELMVKGRTRMVVSDAGVEEAVEDENGRWSPALESIPEHIN